MNANPQFELREMPCAVCGSESRKHVGWRGGDAHHDARGQRIQIVRCNSCTHLYPFPTPFPSADLGTLYDDPDEYFSAHDVEQKKNAGRELIKSLEEKLPGRGSLLDVGCGRGELAWAAKEAGWSVEAVDPSPAHLEWARANLQIEGKLATLEDAKFPDEQFDVVILSAVLEHIYDPYATLREIWRVLKPGGIFYLDAPNEDGLYMRIGNLYMRALGRDWVVNLAPTFPPFHVQGFNPTSLRHLVERAGFELIDFTIIGDVTPATGTASLRKRAEHQAARLVNWIGNRFGAGVYMYAWTRKPNSSKA